MGLTAGAGQGRTAAWGGAARESRAEHDRIAIDGGSQLVRAARRFATRCHARQRSAIDGGRFIEHPLEVAHLLRNAGCSDVVVAAGLLHDVLEDTSVGADELAARFGTDVASLVCAVSDDARVSSYRERKQRLREQVRQTGGGAAMVFAADKISKVQELNGALARDRTDDTSVLGKLGRREQLRRRLQIEHHASREMLRTVAPNHPLVHRLAEELATCPLAHAEAMPSGDGQHLAATPRRTRVSAAAASTHTWVECACRPDALPRQRPPRRASGGEHFA